MRVTAVTGRAGGKRCPLCGKPAAADYRPFCSKRCADVDLNRWLSGVYAVPVAGEDDERDGTAGGPDGAAGHSTEERKRT